MSSTHRSCRLGGSGFCMLSVVIRGEWGKKAVILALGSGILLALVLRWMLLWWFERLSSCLRLYFISAMAEHLAAQMDLAPCARMVPTWREVRRRRLHRSCDGASGSGSRAASWSMRVGVHWPVHARQPSWYPSPWGVATSLMASASNSS